MMDIDLTKIETKKLIEELESRGEDLQLHFSDEIMSAAEELLATCRTELDDYDDTELAGELERRGFNTLTQSQLDALWLAYQSRSVDLLEDWVKSLLGIDRQVPGVFADDSRRVA